MNENGPSRPVFHSSVQPYRDEVHFSSVERESVAVLAAYLADIHEFGAATMEITSDKATTRHRSELLRLGWSIRITTQKMIGGTGYHIFRCGDNFRGEIKKLAPWLLRARSRVLIADAALAPSLVLTIDPLDTVLEHEFISTVGRFLVEA